MSTLAELEEQLVKAKAYLTEKDTAYETAFRNFQDAKRNVEDLEVRIKLMQLLVSGEALSGAVVVREASRLYD